MRLDRTLLLHTWMLGFLVLALGVPAVRSWFPWIGQVVLTARERHRWEGLPPTEP